MALIPYDKIGKNVQGVVLDIMEARQRKLEYDQTTTGSDILAIYRSGTPVIQVRVWSRVQ